MLTKDKIKKWLLKNCVNSRGNLDLSGLDFSDFDGNVDISCMKVKLSLSQDYQEVGENLFQDYQTVGESLFQGCQKVGGNLWQRYQEEVEGRVYQDERKKEGK